jgi:very-short-patch-repair endonuclease/predicted transcriptional regulator of viral defense system
MRAEAPTQPDSGRDARIAALAGSQHGVITRRQLGSLGVAAATITRWLRTGRLHRIHRGVFVVGHRAIRRGTREMAAILACGATAVISHRSAAALWGLLPHLPPRIPVAISVVDGDPRTRSGIEVHRVRTLDPRDHRTLHGIPVTSPARTVLDLAAELDRAGLEQLVAEGLRTKLFTEGDLLDQLKRNRGRAGTAALRAVRDHTGGPKFTRSRAEHILLTALREARLPEPEVNAPVDGVEVDLLWRDERLIVEVDDYRYHADRHAFQADRDRSNALQLRGFVVLRVTWRDLTERPAVVTARIRQALRRR